MADPIRASEMTVDEADFGRIAGRFGLPGLRRLGGFENLLLRSVDGPGRIVRLTHTSRRSLEDVEAEVAFMMHLATEGVSVVAPVASVTGRPVEEFTLGDGSTAVAYCMTEAPGSIKSPHRWSDEQVVALGELLARAHVASASFDPGPAPRRPRWTDPIFDPGTSRLDDPEFMAAWRSVRDRAASHPVGGSRLLIHQDAHFWNLHIDESAGLTLFDFDDCTYATPEHDLAIVLFYWLFVGWPDPIDATRRFLTHLLVGYRRHAGLADDWPEGFDRIMKVREADIYLLIAIDDDPDEQERRWMHGRRARVLEGVPLLGRPLGDLL